MNSVAGALAGKIGDEKIHKRLLLGWILINA